MKKITRKTMALPVSIQLARALLILHVIFMFIGKGIVYLTTMTWTHQYIVHLLICTFLYHQLASKKSANYYIATIYPAVAAINYWHSFELKYSGKDILPIYLYSHWAMLFSLFAVTMLVLKHKNFYDEQKVPNNAI